MLQQQMREEHNSLKCSTLSFIRFKEEKIVVGIKKDMLGTGLLFWIWTFCVRDPLKFAYLHGPYPGWGGIPNAQICQLIDGGLGTTDLYKLDISVCERKIDDW